MPVPNLLQDLHVAGAGAGTIKFTEVDALPGSQQKSAVTDDHCLGGTHHTGFQMSCRVAFSMPISCHIPWTNLVQSAQQVSCHIWVGIFIDGDPGGSMGSINYDQAFTDVSLSDYPLDLAGNIDHLIPLRASHINFVQHAATTSHVALQRLHFYRKSYLVTVVTHF